ncbi:hypothetical protein ABZ330_01610 [Streptomyces sp. NPDC006172]|uniref:hypothetical protein n=1 Tax=Streptomyces sp. NPDC006172 TaxID=3154470 RepID=UPI0033D97378
MTAAEEEPSRTAGACVLVVLGGVAVGVLFAVDEAVGVLAVTVAGWTAMWRSARRLSDSSSPPPPPSEPPSGDVYARETTRVREVRKGPGEGITIFPEIEHVTDPDAPEEVNAP